MGRTVPTPVNSLLPAPRVELPASPAVRMVPARVQGVTITIPCPAWCTVDHAAEDERFFADVYHASDRISVAAPTMNGGTEQVMEAWVSVYPFVHGPEAEPIVAFDAAGGGEVAEIGADAALAFADQLAAHADRLRALARLVAQDAR